MNSEKLNLGCGPDYREGWVNIDINEKYEPDRVIDLAEPDWDLPGSHFQYVLVDNVFEHIEPSKRPTFLKECHRIMDISGEMVMRWPTPGFGGGWDVTHYSIPSWEWPNHPNHSDYWEIKDLSFEYTAIGKFLPRIVAKQLMWYGIRTISSVELTVSPTAEEYGKTW